ncbi:MAG: VOC family protein [Tumebacillaceae bacterium]
MIKGLYETHLQVTDMQRAVDFYQNKLGFELGANHGTASFFWLEKDKKQMLGLWQTDEDIPIRHFA